MQHLVRRVAATAAALLALVLVASCDGVTGPRYGKLTLHLTDAPGDVVSAVVTIDQIYLQGGTDSGAAGRIILRDEPLTVDLLTLVDTTKVLLENVDVPVGSYSQLRFIISGAFVEVEGATENSIYATAGYDELPDGVTADGMLIAPSYAQTGLKVTLPSGVVVINEDETATLVVDFDVSQSFGQQAGASGMWVMTPVVHATAPPEGTE